VSDEQDNAEESKTIIAPGEDRYEKALKHKSVISKAVLKFNIKPKSGVAYLLQVGYLPEKLKRIQ